MKSSPMEPIAIVGMSCRFPGANSLEAFWQLLQNGDSAIDTVPADRWDVEAYYSEAQSPGKMTTRLGGFVSEVDQFEPSFFGITPREAIRMDPQQRLMLELAWEALEQSNTVPADLAGSKTGVFIGCGNYDFGVRMAREYDSFDAHLGTGLTVGISANRLSYLLDLRGPSLTVETACSSALVSLHVACQSLLSGESDACLVGASSLMLSPNQTIIYSQAQMLSPEGRCNTFDASANGYVRGEGCGVLVIKRLVDAQAAGDRILAVICGTAVNQDGRSNGLTAPNGPAQQSVMREALDRAGVAPNQISYVEAHGTGTPLGDPIEIKSLKAVLGEKRSSENPCWIGSVKTNIGHLEAAAGMAGLIKTVLAMQHRKIPPHLNLKTLNPYISFAGTSFSIPTELQPWQTPQPTRLAGISSFGFGGTNAHVILSEPPAADRPVRAKRMSSEQVRSKIDRPLHLLVLSAKSGDALEAMAERYVTYLQTHPGVVIADVCATAAQARSHFEHRLSLVVSRVEEAITQLQQVRDNPLPVGATRRSLTRQKAPRVAFLFTGQGSQSVDMGRQLYETQPSFKASMDRCDRLLQPLLGISLLSVIYPASHDAEAIAAQLNQTAYAQPALFALEYSLAQLWQSWGVEPSVVTGHSVGEYVAACIAGVFSLADGLRLIAERGRLMQALPSGGSMAAVFADHETVEAMIAESSVAIAGYNGPTNTVISGPTAEVDKVITRFEQGGIESRQLAVSHAFHSPAMAPILVDFRQVAEQVTYHSPQIKLVSNLTGDLADAAIATPDYWCQHVTAPVNFTSGAQSLQAQNCPLWLEVGPKPILLGMAQRCLVAEQMTNLDTAATEKKQKQQPPQYFPSLRASRGDWAQLLETLGALYTHGLQINWQRFEADYDRQRLTLPTYPWQRQRYWVAPTDRHGVLAASPLLDLLNGGSAEPLIAELQTQTTFSDSERALLPKLLNSLVQYQAGQTASIQSTQTDKTDADLRQLMCQLTWQIQPRTDAAPISESRSWLILADRGGVGKALGSFLAQRGDRYRLLYSQEVTTDPKTRAATLTHAVTAIFHNGISPVTDVVFLWSLDRLPATAAYPDRRLSGAETWRDVLRLVQILTTYESTAKLWLVTQQATSLSPSMAGLFHSPLWGLGKGIALEHPALWGGLIDLGEIDVEAGALPRSPLIQALTKELLNPEGEDQIAFRAGQRYVARLVPETVPVAPAQVGGQSNTAQRPKDQLAVEDATYLITGGLGALGLVIARWLVQQGARQLVLTGRRQPSEAAAGAISQLKAAGANVLSVQADVTDPAAMSQVFANIQATLPPVKGVVHAAGTARYEALSELTPDSFEQVLAPKVEGAWILHQLTESLNLDFFVCFSSIASVWGSKGQAHYAAANQFLDSLAHYRQAQNLPALTVNWGPWGGGGMVVKEFETWLTRAGITPLSVEKATLALGELLRQGCPQATVVDVDWHRLKALFELRRPLPLLSQMALERSAGKGTHENAANQTGEMLRSLQSVPGAQQKERLITFLQTEVARIMGAPAGQNTPIYQGFFEMGLDSLMAVDLKTQLENSFACELPSTLIFEVPTIHDLAEYLAENILDWNAVPEASETGDEANRTANDPLPRSPVQAIADPSAVEHMSGAEVETSIAEQLARLESLVGGQ